MYLRDSTQVIPIEAGAPDTYHANDTWWQRAVQGDLEIFGELTKYFTGGILKGTAQALNIPEPFLYLGGALLLVYLMKKK